MKIKELRELTNDELLTRKRDLRQESFHLRLQQQSGQLERPSQIRVLRREVARIESILSERRIAGPKPGQQAGGAPAPGAAKGAQAAKPTRAAAS